MTAITGEGSGTKESGGNKDRIGVKQRMENRK